MGIASLGILALVYSRLGLTWYSVPPWVPWRGGFTIASGVILVSCGAGLLFKRSAWVSAFTLLLYLVIWLLMRVPSLAKAPFTAVLWENAAEIGVLVAGALVLLGELADSREGSIPRFATGTNGTRAARILFALSLIAFGVSHFAYIPQTAALVPTWLPFRTGWAYLTGTAHLAAGVGVLLSILPRLAATMEAAMLSVFTLVVWVPAIVAAPTSMPTWTEILISLAVTGGAWVVAGSIPAKESTSAS